VDAVVIIDATARNARFRMAGRLARVLAWIGRLDRQAEARLFLSLRAHMEFISDLMGWRRRRLASSVAAARGVVSEDLHEVTEWPNSHRVAAFSLLTRTHVPGRYAGPIALLVPEERGSLRRDLWWSLVADSVEVHSVPGAHLTSLTEHGPELAERLRACLGGPSAASAP
jgi:hypothetical protein